MFQPSSSRDPLLSRGGDSGSDGGESVGKHAYDVDSNVGKVVYFTDVDEDQSLTPISDSTVLDGVDANVLKLPREDQRFIFVESSPDRKLVVTVTSDRVFSTWDVTNEFVLLAFKRLHHDGRTLKCIAFDPYDEEAVLLCFDSGEIFRANLRGPATSDAPASSQDQGVFHMELVYQCEGRGESKFAHFKFSSDRKMMIYYNLDVEFVAVHFQKQDEPKTVTISKEFALKQDPKIYISGQSILVTAVMQSSEDRESTSEQIETLFWSELDFEDTEAKNNPINLEGKGCLSGDGKYLLISTLAIKHHSTCCQIDLHRAEGVKSNMKMKQTPFETRTLTFTSSHPHLEFPDRNKFNFLNLEPKKTKPLIAIYQTNSVGNRLLLWDTNSDALIYEIDLTLNKGVRHFSEVIYCWSSDYNWLGVYSIGARMVGLVCARSGVFLWTARVPQMRREDVGVSTLGFNPSRTRFMISMGKVIYVFEPPCLSKKTQKHPMNHDLSMSQISKSYSDHEIQELAAWPKHVLFNVLLAGQGLQHPSWNFLLDVAISLRSKTMALICQKHKGQYFLFVVDCSKILSWESLWLLVMSRWNRCFLGNNTSPLLKEIGEDQRHKGLSVFYCTNEGTSNENIVLLSSRDGIEMQVIDSELKELSEWTKLSDESCFCFTQCKDRQRVISLADKHVFIIDLSLKSIVKEVKYSFGLSQWWESFMDGVKFFEYSHYYSFVNQEYDKEHKLFLQERLRGLFDVSEDGETILVGWDNERNSSLVITPDKTEEHFRTEWDDARGSLYPCSMLVEDGKWLGFVDYENLRGGDVVLCVVNTQTNRQQRICLGSDESLVDPCLSQIANFFLQIDKIEENLTFLVLERTRTRANLKKFSLRLLNVGDNGRVHESLLNTTIQPTTLDAYGEAHQVVTFNMLTNYISTSNVFY